MSDTGEDPKMRAKKLERRARPNGVKTESEQSICIGSIGVVSLALGSGQSLEIPCSDTVSFSLQTVNLRALLSIIIGTGNQWLTIFL